MKEIYTKIIANLNDIEKRNTSYLLLIHNHFIKYNKNLENQNLCLKIKMKKKRISQFLDTLDSLNIKYEIYNNNQYYKIIELNKNKNYIVIDYVVDSHVIIPQSFLRLFGYKTNDGIYVNYIDYKDSQIKNKKVKEYGAIYGYYNKFIENKLSSDFEYKIGEVRKSLYKFYKGNIHTMKLSKRKIIMDFVDITSYRNPKFLEKFNNDSLTSILVGGYDHNFLLNTAIFGNFPNIYEDLEINFIINKTDADFIINDTMISNIKVDNGNEIIVLPISPKICIVLMAKEYFKKYIVDGEFYYMRIDNQDEVDKMNKGIFRYAVRNKENVIGPVVELNKLLK